ncbi:MAG: Gfo/Idh/MocA family oxidoreductase [Armatimonadota bacterium]|nr:Gfo/Idh/MocA family oxidoreductase [Armatimonadota bacterium]
MIGIGIIGGGRMAPGHARAVATQDGRAQVRGFASRAPGRAAALAAEHGGAAHLDWRDLLAQPDVDAVVIASPNLEHHEIGLAALQAGKHVLLEKPMAMSLAECDALIAAARRHRRKLMVGQTQHFFAVNRAAEQLLRAGTLGRLVTVTDTWYKPFGLASRRPWFLDRAQGGGMWLMNGTHMIDRMVWLSGSPVVSIKAWIGNPLLGLQADDTCVAHLHHASGLRTTLVHAGYQHGDERWHGEFLCERGLLRLSTFPPGAGLWVARGTQGFEPVPYEERDSLAAQMEAFVDCVARDLPEPVAPEHARHLVAVLLAGEESSRTGREVAVPA